MAAVLGFAICNVSGLDADAYTPIRPKSSWMGVNIVNGSGVTVSLATDPDDATTAYDLLPGYSFMVQAVFGPNTGGSVRFTSGAPAFYLKPASGDGTGITCIWA